MWTFLSDKIRIHKIPNITFTVTKYLTGFYTGCCCVAFTVKFNAPVRPPAEAASIDQVSLSSQGSAAPPPTGHQREQRGTSLIYGDRAPFSGHSASLYKLRLLPCLRSTSHKPPFYQGKMSNAVCR